MSFQQKRFNDTLWRATETVFRGVMDHGFDPYATLFVDRQDDPEYVDFNPALKKDDLKDLLTTEAMKAKEAAFHDAVVAWWFDLQQQILTAQTITRESLLASAETAFIAFGVVDRYGLIDIIDALWAKLGTHIEQVSQGGVISVIQEYLDALRTQDQSRLPLYRSSMIEALFPDLKSAQEALSKEQRTLMSEKETLEEGAIEALDEEGDDEDEDEDSPRRKSPTRGIKALEARLKALKPSKKGAIFPSENAEEIAEIEATLTPYKEVTGKLNEIKKQMALFDGKVSDAADALAGTLDQEGGLILCSLWQGLFIKPLDDLWSKQHRAVLKIMEAWWDAYRQSYGDLIRETNAIQKSLDASLSQIFPWWPKADEEPPAPKKHKRQYRWSRFPRICFIDRLVDTSKAPEPQMVEAYYFEPRPEPKKKGKKEGDNERQKVLF